MKKILLIFVVVNLFSQTSIAQKREVTEKVIQKIDSILTADFKANEPGAVALIAQNGKPLLRKGYGMANLEFEVPMKPEHKVEIGSITKQFTAVGILILHEQGKLSIKDDIKKYVPEFNTHGETITIEHLITMTGGIPGGLEIQGFDLYYQADIDEYAELNFVQGKPLLFKPGTNWSYSNASFALAGLIIERVSKMKYMDFITRNIFGPLQMKDTYFGSNLAVKNQAYGYMRTRRGFEAAHFGDYWETATYAGRIVTTIDDMLKWNEGLEEGKIIKPALLQQAHSSYILKDGVKAYYGYGWRITEIEGKKLVSHGGGTNGFNAYAFYIPADSIYAIVVNNQAANKALVASVKSINILFGLPIMPALAKTDLKINTTDLVGTYESLFTGSRIQGNFSTTPRVQTVIEENGKVFIKNTARNRFEILPIDEETFAASFDPFLKFTFAKDNQGKVIGLYVGNDKRVLNRKISNTITKAPTTLPLDSIKALPYTGIFKTTNANNRDYFIQKGGKLWLKESKDANPQELAFIGNDSFILTSDYERTFKFSRDKKDKVIKVEQKTAAYDVEMMRWDVIN